MRRSQLVTALVVAGIALLVAWIAMNTYWDTVKIPGLLHGEALTNPDYTASRLARQLGSTLETLSDPLAPLPPAGAVLVLADTNLELQPERLRAIEDWVMRGGHLVIDQGDSLGDAELNHWAGLEQRFVQRPRKKDGADGAGDAEPGPTERERKPCRIHAASGSVATQGDYELCNFYLATRLHSARRPDFALGDDDGLQVVRVPLGRGSLSLLDSRDTFGNRGLLRGDHALLFATLARLRPGATIWVLRGGGGPGLLGLVWNRAAGVVLLLLAALALALWRAATRFGPMRDAPPPMRRSLRARIAGNARFLLAFGGGPTLLQAAQRALDAAFTRRLPNQARLAPAERVAALARLTGMPVDELTEALQGEARGRAAQPTRRLALLELARRRLLNH